MCSKKLQTKGLRISLETYNRLTKLKAPKQVYDGFIGQLLDLWEENLKKAGPAGGNQGAGVSLAHQLK